MYDISPFIQFMQPKIGVDMILPTGSHQPAGSYVSVMGLISNQDDIYQRARNIVSTTETTYGPSYTSFSLTAISSSNNKDAENIAQSMFNILRTQVTDDFFDARGEALHIVGKPQARYVLQHDFNEKRWGFDIQIAKTIKIVDTSKGFIETIKTHDTGGKIADITVVKP